MTATLVFPTLGGGRDPCSAVRPLIIIVVLVIVLLILGPKRLPGIGKGLGQGMREFKEGITGDSKDDEDKPALSEARAMPESEPSSTEPAATPDPESSRRPDPTAGSERSS